jgi:hypothetical protein
LPGSFFGYFLGKQKEQLSWLEKYSNVLIKKCLLRRKIDAVFGIRVRSFFNKQHYNRCFRLCRRRGSVSALGLLLALSKKFAAHFFEYRLRRHRTKRGPQHLLVRKDAVMP